MEWRRKTLKLIWFVIGLSAIHWAWKSARWSDHIYGVTKNRRVFEMYDINANSLQNRIIEEYLYDSPVTRMINSFNMVRIAEYHY